MNTTEKNTKINKGFSMVELMLSMTIILIALISIIGLFISLFRSSQKGLDLTNGMVVAESVMNQYLYEKQGSTKDGLFQNLQENVLNPDTGTTQEFYSDGFSHKTIYSYEIVCRDLKSELPNNLKRVDVTVSWWRNPERDSEYKSGYGKLTVKLSRIVYTSDLMEIVPEF